MNRILALIACGTLALAGCTGDHKAPTEACAVDNKSASGNQGWETLFDGKSLDAFTVPANGSWVVTDQGELHVAKVGPNLYTKKRYCDFIVACDFKLAGHAKANSGVLLRVHDQADPVNTGMEIQILDNEDHGVAFDAHNACGALYDMVAPAVPAVNPIGEWNHYKITVNDNVVQVELNGKAIVDADLNKWTTPHENPNGTKNKYPHAIGNLPREGFVALQNHGGTPVWFRNVRIKALGDRQPKFTGKEPISEVLSKPEAVPGK
jgi:hypothetical protein